MIRQYQRSSFHFWTLSQLKETYEEIGCSTKVKDKRIKENWIEAILAHQSAQVELVDAAEFASSPPKITCTDCPLFKPFNDGTGRGLCCGVADTSLVVREHHTQTQDCLNLIDEQAQQIVEFEAPKFEKKVIHTFYKQADAWHLADAAYFEKLAELNSLYPLGELVGGVHDSEQTQALSIAPEIEVDSDIDPDFGELYRVWYSYHLLGTFYQAADGKWIAQPCDTENRPSCNTAAEAQLLIVAMSGLLVADTADDVIDLIDEPVAAA